MSTSYGKKLNITIYGGSHDDEIGVIATGLPKDFVVNREKLLSFMQRRAPGTNEFSTKRREGDIPVFLSGMDDDGTLNGDTLKAVIRNTDQRSADYKDLSFVPRPSHADFAAKMKYGDSVDLRGGGHFSGRLTAPLCIVGGICLQYLRKRGIYIFSHIYSIGGVNDCPFDPVNVSLDDRDLLRSREKFPVLNAEAGEKMKQVIRDAAASGDSVGGIVECAAIGLPAGLGEHMFCSVEGRISSIVFGIPAVKGIEFGLGFGSARLFGSQNNDPFYTDGKNIYTKTNNCGGILGGMSNGMPVIFRAAVKPTPSIAKEQDSVSLSKMENVKLNIGGRHDPCILPRAVPVFEAACAIAILDMLLDQ